MFLKNLKLGSMICATITNEDGLRIGSFLHLISKQGKIGLVSVYGTNLRFTTELSLDTEVEIISDYYKLK